MSERLVLPAPVRVKTKRQTAAEARKVYKEVTARDVTCRAPVIDAEMRRVEQHLPPRPPLDACDGRIEREHVMPGGGAMGRRRITRLDTVLLLCRHHHHDGWATSHKSEERDHLAKLNAPR